MSEAPKSALDIVLERLRKKDADSGVEAHPLTDEQRAAIAEVRKLSEAGFAERKIMHAAAVAGVTDPAERAEREAELARDLARFERQREEKIRKIRGDAPGT